MTAAGLALVTEVPFPSPAVAMLRRLSEQALNPSSKHWKTQYLVSLAVRSTRILLP